MNELESLKRRYTELEAQTAFTKKQNLDLQERVKELEHDLPKEIEEVFNEKDTRIRELEGALISISTYKEYFCECGEPCSCDFMAMQSMAKSALTKNHIGDNKKVEK